jgi:hypothetical protein
VNITFRALIHSLVDLINEGEGRARHAREGHEVCDGREGSFLSMVNVLTDALYETPTPPDCFELVRTSNASPLR